MRGEPGIVQRLEGDGRLRADDAACAELRQGGDGIGLLGKGFGARDALGAGGALADVAERDDGDPRIAAPVDAALPVPALLRGLRALLRRAAQMAETGVRQQIRAALAAGLDRFL